MRELIGEAISLSSGRRKHPPLPRAGAEPRRDIWQYLRANWLSNRVFETYEAIIDGRLRGLEQTHRAASCDLINRDTLMGACGSIPMTVGITTLTRLQEIRRPLHSFHPPHRILLADLPIARQHTNHSFSIPSCTIHRCATLTIHRLLRSRVRTSRRFAIFGLSTG